MCSLSLQFQLLRSCYCIMGNMYCDEQRRARFSAVRCHLLGQCWLAGAGWVEHPGVTNAQLKVKEASGRGHAAVLCVCLLHRIAVLQSVHTNPSFICERHRTNVHNQDHIKSSCRKIKAHVICKIYNIAITNLLLRAGFRSDHSWTSIMSPGPPMKYWSSYVEFRGMS